MGKKAPDPFNKMFDLTRQERRVILFLIAVALLGLGISFAVKINPRLERFVKADASAVKINLNMATPEDIAATKAVSSNLAGKIIEYRETQGPFGRLEDLKKIKGIGDYRYKKLEDIFYVE